MVFKLTRSSHNTLRDMSFGSYGLKLIVVEDNDNKPIELWIERLDRHGKAYQRKQLKYE